MKRTCFFLLIILSVLSSSCNSYRAITKRQENLKYEAVKVFPEWKYMEQRGKKMIAPVIGTTLGALYGSKNQLTIDGETLKKDESATFWGGAGFLTAVIINQVVFPGSRYKKKKFDIAQSEEWVKDYNKTNKSDYSIHKKESNNAIVLVHERRLEALRKQYKVLINDIESEKPSTSFNSLQDWKSQLNGQYSILPSSEISLVSAAIDRNGRKIADIELLEKASSLVKLEDEYESIDPLINFRKENQLLYTTADKASQEGADKMVEEKVNTVLKKTLIIEAETLKGIGNDEEDVVKVNRFYENFNKKYKMVLGFKQIEDFHSLIEDKKTSIVAINSDKISGKIKDAKTLKQLDEAENLYLSLIKQSDNPKIAVLSKKVSDRKTAIEKENNRIIEQQKMAEAMAMKGFDIDGLNNEELIKNIYLGNFAKIPFDRDNLLFVSMIKSYMYGYAKNCESILPDNRVQINEDVCARESVTTDRWGNEKSRYCIQWTEVGTGLYASPKLYNAYKTVKNISDKDAMKNAWKMLMDMAQGGSASTLNEIVLNAESIQSDMNRVIQKNGCDNTALKRFEENLIQFANNDQPIKLDGTTDDKLVDYGKNQDLAKLTEDLVSKNSKSWTFKYVSNSVSNVNVIVRDSQNRPKKVTANYKFEGLSGTQKDEVQITFKDGLPDCIYFLNYSSNCRTPDRKVVSDFVDGKYEID